MRGIGPVKIEELKEAGFRVEQRQAAAVEGGEPGADWLRADVRCMKDQVWRFTSNNCLYTLLPKRQVEQRVPEVDHRWEIQVLKYAYALDGARDTRGARQALKSIVNSELNLNVTTHQVNQAKKGPFMRMVNLYKSRDGYRGAPSFEDMNCVPRKLVDDGHWARIESAMVVSYEQMERQTSDLRDDAQRRLAERVMKHVHGMIGQMGIES